MPPKRATFFTNGDDSMCIETMKFIEDAGCILSIRDMKKNPLTYNELRQLIGYIDLKHFLNTFSDSYKKHRLGESYMDRADVIKLIEKDPTLLKMPIIKSVRLLTVGCSKKKIAQMLQISINGSEIVNEDPRGNIKNGRNDRKGSPKKTAITAK